MNIMKCININHWFNILPIIGWIIYSIAVLKFINLMGRYRKLMHQDVEKEWKEANEGNPFDVYGVPRHVPRTAIERADINLDDDIHFM